MSEDKDDLEWVIATELSGKELYYTGAYVGVTENTKVTMFPQFKENYNLALKCQTQGQANRIKEQILLFSPMALQVKGMLPAIPKINKVTSLDTVVFEAIGEASMCWSEQPTGEFDNVAANIVADKLIANICKVTGYKI